MFLAQNRIRFLLLSKRKVSILNKQIMNGLITTLITTSTSVNINFTQVEQKKECTKYSFPHVKMSISSNRIRFLLLSKVTR
jgi:hypothetical protein